MNSRVESLCGKLKDIADCALVTSDVSRRYLTDMKSSAGTLLVFPEKAYLIIDFRYIEKARSCVTSCEVVLESSLIEQINELLTKHNAKTVAVESDSITLSAFLNLKNKLSAEVMQSEKLSEALSQMRMIKSEREVQSIIKAQRIAEKALEETLNFIKPGVTEREIALHLDFEMQKRGSEGVSFETIALSGVNTSMPHGVPSDKTVSNGEFVLMDFGAVCDGYHSDMTRTVAVGKVSEKAENIYNTVLAAQLAAIDKAKADITGKELDGIARQIINDAGYKDCFGHSLGHGVGLVIHELPNASPRYEKALPEGCIVTVEPGIYVPGELGVRIEDMVLLTKEGCNNLTSSPKQLIVL